MPGSTTRLLLVRHAEVASHKGDVPITQSGSDHASRCGRAIGAALRGPVTVLHGGTRRTRETAEAVVRAIHDDERVDGPHVAFALRNPDMYLSGSRVDMVSSPDALAEQVPGLSTDQVRENPWWMEFFASPDRIGWWLARKDPPGETVVQLNARILQFARSLADPGPLRGRTVVAVTHSPVLRAVVLQASGRDPGEPSFVTGVEVLTQQGETPSISTYDPLET